MTYIFDSGLPTGDYLVQLNNIELITSRELKPMIAITFEVMEDGIHAMESNSFTINQVIDEGFKIHRVNEFVRFLLDATNPDNEATNPDSPEYEYTVKFVSYANYAVCMKSISTYIQEMKAPFCVTSGKDKKNRPYIRFYEIDNPEPTEVPTYWEYLEEKFG